MLTRCFVMLLVPLWAGCLSSPIPVPTSGTPQDVKDSADLVLSDSESVPDSVALDSEGGDTQPEAHLSDVGVDGGNAGERDAGEGDADEGDSGEVVEPGPERVIYSTVESRPAAVGARVRIVFDPLQGGAPVELSVPSGSGASLLWAGTGIAERLAGVLFYDYHASWDGAEQATIERLVDGPGVVRLRVTWTAASDGAGSLFGTTMWTIHDDGRIHRNEQVSVIDDRMGWLVGYHTIPIGSAARIVWADADGQHDASAVVSLEGSFENALPNNTDARWVCGGDFTGDSVLFTVHDAAPESAGLRATWNGQQGSGATHSLHLQFDWLRQEVPTAQAWTASLMTWVGAAGCPGGAAYALAHRTPPGITLQSGSWASSDSDYDGDGYDEGGGFFAVMPAESMVRARFDGIGAPSSTWFLVTDAAEAPTVRVAGQALAAEEFATAPADGGWFVFVDRAIAVGDTLELNLP